MIKVTKNMANDESVSETLEMDDHLISRSIIEYEAGLKDGSINFVVIENSKQGFMGEKYGSYYADHSINACGMIVMMCLVLTSIGIMNAINFSNVINHYCGYISAMLRTGRVYDYIDVHKAASRLKCLGLSKNICIPVRSAIHGNCFGEPFFLDMITLLKSNSAETTVSAVILIMDEHIIFISMEKDIFNVYESREVVGMSKFAFMLRCRGQDALRIALNRYYCGRLNMSSRPWEQMKGGLCGRRHAKCFCSIQEVNMSKCNELSRQEILESWMKMSMRIPNAPIVDVADLVQIDVVNIASNSLSPALGLDVGRRQGNSAVGCADNRPKNRYAVNTILSSDFSSAGVYTGIIITEPIEDCEDPRWEVFYEDGDTILLDEDDVVESYERALKMNQRKKNRDVDIIKRLIIEKERKQIATKAAILKKRTNSSSNDGSDLHSFNFSEHNFELSSDESSMTSLSHVDVDNEEILGVDSCDEDSMFGAISDIGNSDEDIAFTESVVELKFHSENAPLFPVAIMKEGHEIFMKCFDAHSEHTVDENLDVGSEEKDEIEQKGLLIGPLESIVLDRCYLFGLKSFDDLFILTGCSCNATVNAGVHAEFFTRNAATMGHGYTFTKLSDNPSSMTPDRFRVPFMSTWNCYATMEQRQAVNYVSCLQKMDCTFVQSRKGSKLFPIEGSFKTVNLGLIVAALKLMQEYHNLQPSSLSFHRIGPCEVVPVVPKTSKSINSKLLNHYSLELADDETLKNKMPMLYLVYLSLSEEAHDISENDVTILQWNTANIDLRVHELLKNGEEYLFAKHPDASGRVSAVAGIVQACASYALHKSGGGRQCDADAAAERTEKRHGGSVQIYLSPGVSSKKGRKDDSRENPTNCKRPNTMVPYCHNIVSVVKNTFSAFSIFKTLHSNKAMTLTFGQASDLVDAILDHDKLGSLFPIDLKTSIDVEVNFTLGGSGSVNDGDKGFRKFILGLLKVLYEGCTNNAAYVSSIRTLPQRKECANIFANVIKETKYFKCSSRGTALPDVKKPALLMMISILGVSLANSYWRRFLKGHICTYGEYEGSFKAIIGMKGGYNKNISELAYSVEDDSSIHESEYGSEISDLFVDASYVTQPFGVVAKREGFYAWPTITCNPYRPKERGQIRNDIRLKLSQSPYDVSINAHKEVCHFLFDQKECVELLELLRFPYALKIGDDDDSSEVKIAKELKMLNWYLNVLPKLHVKHVVTKFGIGAVLSRYSKLGYTKKVKWSYDKDDVIEGLHDSVLTCFFGFRRDVEDTSPMGRALEKAFVVAENNLMLGILMNASLFFETIMHYFHISDVEDDGEEFYNASESISDEDIADNGIDDDNDVSGVVMLNPMPQSLLHSLRDSSLGMDSRTPGHDWTYIQHSKKVPKDKLKSVKQKDVSMIEDTLRNGNVTIDRATENTDSGIGELSEAEKSNDTIMEGGDTKKRNSSSLLRSDVSSGSNMSLSECMALRIPYKIVYKMRR